MPRCVGAVEHRREPVEVEPSVLRFPGGPDRLADPDDGEAGVDHQVEVGLQPVERLVLVVVGGAEQHLLAGRSMRRVSFRETVRP